MNLENTLPAADISRAEVRRLGMMLEVSQALSDTLHLEESLQKALKALARHPNVIRGLVTLYRKDLDPLRLSSKGGYKKLEVQRLFEAEEDIRVQVRKSGKPVVIPQVSQEPSFRKLGKRKSELKKRETSYISVPILVRRKIEGVLATELHYGADRDYDRAVKFLTVISTMIAQAFERKSLVEENLLLKEELKQRYDFSNIIGKSRPMLEVYQQISQVARANTTVLIRGDSGTGKELIAHAIHYNSLRAQKPFVRVSCAALPETLIETELFGHEKGAFTDAQFQKKGRFELAEGGTLFLDEIGDLNPAMQVKLLRVLQEREFERVGGQETIRVNVRLIAATNKDLEEGMRTGGFREDFYYRLNVFSIFVPGLRERKSDLMLLAEHFLEKYAGQHGKNIRRISTPAIDMLHSYHWPGNVRELENTIERAVLVCDGPVVHGHHLSPALQTAEASGTVIQVPFDEAVSDYEKDLLMDTLKTTRGNRAEAARLLQTTERILGYKVKKYQIECSRFRYVLRCMGGRVEGHGGGTGILPVIPQPGWLFHEADLTESRGLPPFGSDGAPIPHRRETLRRKYCYTSGSELSGNENPANSHRACIVELGRRCS
jgi:Nif-specific regulatory protein